MKIFKYLGVSLLVVWSLSQSTLAFDSDLYFGIKAKIEVIKLQDFLKKQGFFNEESSGNFLSLTKKAVQNFQQSEGIARTGYFGPITRVAALRVLNGFALQNTKATFKLVYPNQVQSFVEGQRQFIKWTSENYPQGSNVNIFLLKETSSSPKSYGIIKNIKINTPNDGEELWIPAADEVGDNMLIQISCGSNVSNGCVAAISDKTFSLVKNDAVKVNINTASAIEALQNTINELQRKINALQ